MTRLLTFAEGEYYHVYNRGTEKRKLFLDKSDHERFISLLYLCNNTHPVHRSDRKNLSTLKLFSLQREETLVDIGAYCLMPNHFHLLLREHSEGGLTLFMQKVSVAYAMYFNKKYSRKGVLFEGKFKAQHVTKDEHLKYLFAYIHLNPIGIIDREWKKHRIKNKADAKRYIKNYVYSSFFDYANTETRPENNILNKSAFPEYFETIKDFEECTQNWIEYSEEAEG